MGAGTVQVFQVLQAVEILPQVLVEQWVDLVKRLWDMGKRLVDLLPVQDLQVWLGQ